MEDDQTKTKALGLYCQGYSMREIASELGATKSTVNRWILEGLEELRQERKALLANYMERELASLDAMERLLYETQRATPGREFETVAGLLKVKERRAKYLALDKPAEVKHTLSLEDLVAGATGEGLEAAAIAEEEGGTPKIESRPPTPPTPAEIFLKSNEPL